MKLKRCCRTCKNLSPHLNWEDYYDYEENYSPMAYSVNCEYCGSEDIDEETVCEYYECIDINSIKED